MQLGIESTPQNNQLDYTFSKEQSLANFIIMDLSANNFRGRLKFIDAPLLTNLFMNNNRRVTTILVFVCRKYVSFIN